MKPAVLLALAIFVSLTLPHQAGAKSAAEIDAQTHASLKILYALAPSARGLAGKARAVLVCPNFVQTPGDYGGSYGEGALIEEGQVVGDYRCTGGAPGGPGWSPAPSPHNTFGSFPAGGHGAAGTYSYVLFLMTPAALAKLAHLSANHGWAIGVIPAIVVVDRHALAKLASLAATKDIVAFAYDSSGLMSGVSVLDLDVSPISR